MILIFSYLNHIQIGRMYQTSKYLSGLKNVRFYTKLFLKNLNHVIDKPSIDHHIVSILDKEYRLKMCILERINNTLAEFKRLLGDNNNWFVSGGMAMRFNGFNRMTYDLDIFMIDGNLSTGDGSLWWQTAVDKILETNKWVHIVDPLDDPDLYMNYGHSWAHPVYKIKVDIINYCGNESSMQLVQSADGTRYPSIDMLAKIKMDSIYQRDENDYCGRRKDFRDYMTLLAKSSNSLHNNDENICHVDILKNVNESLTQSELNRMSDNLSYLNYSIPYIIALNLNDLVILEDITLNSKPPDDHISWNCWRQKYEFDRNGSFRKWNELPFDIPYEPFSCISCQDKDNKINNVNFFAQLLLSANQNVQINLTNNQKEWD
jgi:hypothetical protein